MAAQEHEQTVRRWIDAWNTQDVDAAISLLSTDFVRHDANLPEVVGPSAQRDFLLGVFRAFPDIRIEAQRFIAEGDNVAVPLMVRGTHHGEFLGVPATGQSIAIQSVDIFRLADGRIAEQWVVMDALSLMQQIGAVPSHSLR